MDVVTVPADLKLHPIGGKEVTMAQQVSMFHFVAVVIDPYTYESSWILEPARRILFEYDGADCRPAWIVTADEDDAKEFLGPLANEYMTFTDPDRNAVKAFELESLPALVHVGTNLEIAGSAEGWNPSAWRAVTHTLSDMMYWHRPNVPEPNDPLPFVGSPALG